MCTPAKSSVSFLLTEVIAETPSSHRLSLLAILSSPKLKTQLKEHLTALHGPDTASHLKTLFSGKTAITYGVRYDDLTDRFRIGDANIDENVVYGVS